MRCMDGLMSIPTILLAIALMAVLKASLTTVVVAITVVEVPRVVRLVRSLVLSLREQPYVEAAIAAGTNLPLILLRHILPNTVAPLLVQGTYICASAMITEAILSFIGAGTPPHPELGQHLWPRGPHPGRRVDILAPAGAGRHRAGIDLVLGDGGATCRRLRAAAAARWWANSISSRACCFLPTRPSAPSTM
jgi:hypothetical protein